MRLPGYSTMRCRRHGLPLALLLLSLLLAPTLHPQTITQTITLTLATHYTDDQRAPLTACLARYQQLHPQIHIVHTQMSFRDMLQTIFLARMGGNPPDIYSLSTAWIPQLAQTGALAVPPADVAGYVQAAYLPSTIAPVTVAGRLWGIPSETDVYMLVYNKRLFAQAGIAQPPADMQQWVDDAARISRTNRQGQFITSGFSFGPSQQQVVAPFLALLFSSGERFYTADGRGTHLDTAAARNVLATEVRLFHTGGAAWGTVPYQFPSGTLGMMIVPNWFQRSLHQGLEGRFDQTVGVAPIPGGPNWRTLQYGFAWSVDSASPHREQAWSLLRWLNTAQATGGRSCVGDMLVALGGLSGNRADLAASTAELDNPFMRPFVQALASGRSLAQPAVPHANEIESLTSRYLERALLGTMPPDRALETLNASIHQILEGSEP